MRPYSIHFGQAICNDCGRSLKKYYNLNNRILGSECVKKYVGDFVSDEELSTPAWVIEVAEKYVQYRIKRIKSGQDYLEGADDFTINFYNEDFGVPMVLRAKDGTPLVDNGRPIKINGKTVKSDWQTGVYYYLLQRHFEISREL